MYRYIHVLSLLFSMSDNHNSLVLISHVRCFLNVSYQFSEEKTNKKKMFSLAVYYNRREKGGCTSPI